MLPWARGVGAADFYDPVFFDGLYAVWNQPFEEEQGSYPPILSVSL